VKGFIGNEQEGKSEWKVEKKLKREGKMREKREK